MPRASASPLWLASWTACESPLQLQLGGRKTPEGRMAPRQTQVSVLLVEVQLIQKLKGP